MPTQCSPELFEFAPVASRAVVAGFDGGAITSDAGALLLGVTDRAGQLDGLPNASLTAAARNWWSIEWRRWLGSECSGLRSATRISTITTSCVMIR